MPLVQTDRLLTLHTPLGADALLVQSMEGVEPMSGLFQFQLVLVSEKKNIALQDLVAQRVTLEIELAGKKKRVINGFVSRFSQGDVDSRVSHYYMEVVPWLWFLTRTTDCRIFQKKSVPDIVQQIFKDIGFTDFKLQLQGTFEPREYCVQYRESDFNFASRLMEEEGIFYYFEHTAEKHFLVLGNAPGVHQPVPNQAQAKYAYLHGGNQPDDIITRWHLEQEFQPGKTTLADYYFQTPSNNLRVSAPGAVKVAGNDRFELYDYPGNFAKRFDGDDKASKVKPDGERTVKLGIQQAEALHKVVHGAGTCRAFLPGFRFELTEHRRPDLNGPYVITQVSHSANNNLGDGESATYDNTFTCIPHAVPFRPSRAAQRPTMRGSQTAVVVGLAGEEIDTDKYGRVKVQFHWDREGKKDQNSSCWIRVAQPWAGKGFGMVHIPRIGQEVVVDFLEGDPDQPIVIGSVYNAEQTVPFDLPKNKMVMGLKSNSTPKGGGYNEITLNDTKGKEKITVHGQYDMNTTVENNQTTTVHNNRTDAIDVDDTETVGSNQKCTVGANQDIKVASNQTVTVGGNQKVGVGGARTVEVKGADKLTVDGAQDFIIGGAQTFNVTGAVKIVSAASITLEVGGSSIKIMPGGIEIVSSGPITATGSVVKVNS